MALVELSGPDALSTFLEKNPHSLICFSATWCGPCKAAKPELEALASGYAAETPIRLACGIIYEHVLENDIHAYKVKAFPTYALFKGTTELGRVEGVNFDGIAALVADHCKSSQGFVGGGNSLGGSGAAAASQNLSPAEARALRLARFGGAATSTAPAVEKKEEKTEVPDAEMKDAPQVTVAVAAASKEDTKMDVDEPEVEMVDPTENLKKEDVATLTVSMGFSVVRAQKGLLNGIGNTVESAVEWLLAHQDDADIDDPIEKVPKGGLVAKSYKCVKTGKIFSSMANLELYANRTGYSDFEESTEIKAPLTAEEKAAKIVEIKALLKAKQAEREEVEKAENVTREKERRTTGQKTAKTREQMDIDARKRQARERKREKDAAVHERQRIRAQLEQDKRERMANNGKLKGRLGVDGYDPDGIQYDAPSAGGDGNKDDQANADEASAAKKPKKAPPSVAKMDEYVTKVSSYRAGGDGGTCLKILKAYIGNVVKNPDDLKYRKINMENKAYKQKVKPFVGAKSLLLCIGFAPNEAGTAMELNEDADMEVITQAKEKVEAAYEKYMK